jgi:hypothetical protein
MKKKLKELAEVGRRRDQRWKLEITSVASHRGRATWHHLHRESKYRSS